MSIIQSIILGLVQGLSEFLPISSSGHLAVFQHFMGIREEDVLTFTVMLHFGDEEMLKNSEAYFQTSTQVMGEFDSELRKYGEIICQYKDGTIYNIDYEEYEKRRLRYEELRKRNN